MTCLSWNTSVGFELAAPQYSAIDNLDIDRRGDPEPEAITLDTLIQLIPSPPERSPPRSAGAPAQQVRHEPTRRGGQSGQTHKGRQPVYVDKVRSSRLDGSMSRRRAGQHEGPISPWVFNFVRVLLGGICT